MQESASNILQDSKMHGKRLANTAHASLVGWGSSAVYSKGPLGFTKIWLMLMEFVCPPRLS